MFGFFRKKSKVEAPEQPKPVFANQQIQDDFEAVKTHPGAITGADFARAFDFIEHYPGSELSDILLQQMYATTSQSLKGLNYDSAVKVLERMPDHAGADSIIRGMYKLEEDFIPELSSYVIAYMLDIIPDHPLGEQLAAALPAKSIAAAYEFIQAHPDNIYTEIVIRCMFETDAGIALLLLQEKMDHPKADVILESIYAINDPTIIGKLTPNAILFVLETAPDHPQLERFLESLVEGNYLKAYQFAQENPDFVALESLQNYILAKKPELKNKLG